MISEIRPEDFEIRYRTKNRFRFMGNGRTKMEYDPKAVSLCLLGGYLPLPITCSWNAMLIVVSML